MRWSPLVFVLLSACAASKGPVAGSHPKTTIEVRARIVAPSRFATPLVELARRDRLDAEVRADGAALDVTVRGEGALVGCRWLLASVAAGVAKDREQQLAPLRDKRELATNRLRVVEAQLDAMPPEAELPSWETAYALAKKRLANKEVSKPLAREYARAVKDESELRANYGPQHPVVKQAAAETMVLSAQRAREQQLEADAAQEELVALDAMPKTSRTPVDVNVVRRRVLAKRLAAPGVTAERGVDTDAPFALRALAFEHLVLRIDRARDALVYGDAHPKMIASKARLAELERAFAAALADAVTRLSTGAVLPQSEAEGLRRERTGLIEQIGDLTGKEAMVLISSPEAKIERDCAP